MLVFSPEKEVTTLDNSAPEVAIASSVTIAQGGTTQIPFTIRDLETQAGKLKVTITTINDSNGVFMGNGIIALN